MFQTTVTVTLRRGMGCVGMKMMTMMMVLIGSLEAETFNPTDKDQKQITQQLIQLEQVIVLYKTIFIAFPYIWAIFSGKIRGF